MRIANQFYLYAAILVLAASLPLAARAQDAVTVLTGAELT